MKILYQILTRRRMSSYGAHSRYRSVWTFCGKDEYDMRRRSELTARNARKLLIEKGRKTLVVNG